MANKLVDGYKSKPIPQAEVFFKTQFPLATNRTLSREQNKHLQGVLWEMFRCDRDVRNRALAGLCLRCYVSQRILITCKTLPRIYNASAENLFTYTDILPLVLNDDGKALVIVDSDGKTQHILSDRTTEALSKGQELFSVEILRIFNPQLNSSQNLDNWTTTLTRQNENIRSFLWEIGLATPSDWGLLCKDFPRSLSPLLLTLVIHQKYVNSQEIDVLVKVIPDYSEGTDNPEYLPPGLKLKVTLNPNTSESVSREVTARKIDNAIQLEFSETPNKQFKVEVSYQYTVLTEELLSGERLTGGAAPSTNERNK